MSCWTCVKGMITVTPMGRTQAEMRYILETVLNHLPIVTGSERDMDIEIVEKKGYTSSCSSDEYGDRTNNLINRYGEKSFRDGWLRTNDEYILVIYGAFRDRLYSQTYKELQNWLCRLSKRVMVNSVLVKVTDDWDKSEIITNTQPYRAMFEDPSWVREKVVTEEVNWCEHLMWHRAPNSSYPDLLEYKYYDNEENDKKVEKYYFNC